jgi:hypothetical protein
MLYFPQLTTGTATQFPCTKRIVQRTVVNQQADWGTIKLFDPAACSVQWELQLSGLTTPEWNAIDNLFEAVEGQLGTFCFLDPFGNLLSWSEELSAAVWTKDTAIQVTDGAADPFGASSAARVTNTGPTEQSICQAAGVPGWFQCCLSVYARSDTPATVKLFAAAGTNTTSQVLTTGPAWRRLQLSTVPGAQTESVTFGWAIAAGTTVDLFGFQAEPQVGASKYKPTTTQNGIFPNSSFLSDELKMTSNAPGEFSCTVRIGASAS